MMKIEFQIDEKEYELAKRYEADPVSRAKNSFLICAELARQEFFKKPENMGKNDDQLIAETPSIIEQQAIRERLEKNAEIAQSEKSKLLALEAEKQRKTQILAMLQDPEMLAAAAKAQGLKVVAA